VALATLPGLACKDAPVPAASAAPAPAPAPAPATGDGGALGLPSVDGRALHFTRLQEFAPDKLLEFQGGKTAASTAQIGEVAVSELERTYVEGDRTVKLRFVDTTLNRGARAPKPGPAFEDDQKIGRPVQTAGASGYVEFEKESRRAAANLIVADRVLVSMSLENAHGPEDVERLAAALDLRRLEALLAEPPPEPAAPR